MIYINCIPRSQEWFYARLGKPTASEFFRIVTPTGQISKQCTDYAHRLLAELWLRHPLDAVETQYMVRGVELEDQAIDAYEFMASRDTLPGGFITTDDGTYGCSPDRLIGDDGILEIKCPAPNTHIGYLLSPASMAQEKYPQIQGQLLVSEREYVDLVSFHPDLPMVIHRVKRDEPYIDKLRTALNTFVQTLALMREKLELAHGAFPPIVIPQPLADDDPGALGVSQEELRQMITNGLLEAEGREVKL